MRLDKNHNTLSCTTCHAGGINVPDKEQAHLNLIAEPALPRHINKTCGPCHTKISKQITTSLHYSLKKSTNLFRKAFGATEPLQTFLNTPQVVPPHSILDLADDLLHRRCFNCHPFNHGDDYPLTGHGTGCGSCHLHFVEGSLVNHNFQKPHDDQCFSCHYGNYVGFDYYGRFEHDLNTEYRTPYTTKDKFFRPYGIEFHQLRPDIHHLKGLWCIDCHSGTELMSSDGAKISCESCHVETELISTLPRGVKKIADHYIFHAVDGRDHPLPTLRHPAHFTYQGQVTCQACHAQWTFNDLGKHYIRYDNDGYDTWDALTTQGNFTVQSILENNLDFDKDEIPPEMDDKLSGKIGIGIWLKSYSQRRWGDIKLGRDRKGRITTLRPMLDYYLSWVDEDDIVRFSSQESRADNNGYQPYTPHTTGAAGIFYQQRIRRYLKTENQVLKQ